MLGHFGFSYMGLIYLVLLFVPNLAWAKQKPKDYSPEGENRVLRAFEMVGQVSITVLVLIFTDFNYQPAGAWNVWLIASYLFMVLYEFCWLRYFKAPSMETFYGGFLGVPVPLATLPVCAFFLLGVYGRVGLLVVASVVLGVGHIGIHLGHLKAWKRKK